jgi:hypothetical protein
MMSRHISNEEKNSVIEAIQSLIDQKKWKIQDRQSNNKFKKMSGMSKPEIISIIRKYIKPQNIVGVIPNKNYPEYGSPELYLLKMFIKQFSVYVKVDIKKDCVEFWSIHSLTGTLDRDFQNASDYSENNLIRTFVWEWKQKYNEKAPEGYEIINSFIIGNSVHFDFACGDVNYNNVKNFINLLIETKPHRLYDIAELNSHVQLDIDSGGIRIKLVEK